MRAGFLFLSLIFLSWGAQSAERTISVTGQCIKKIAPDRGTVTLVAQFTDKSAKIASKKAMDVYEKIRTAVSKLKLKDLEMQTSEYNIQELVEYDGNKRVSRGVQASMGLQISTSEISRLGEVIALTSQLEIRRVEGLSTYLSREATKSANEACLAEAIKNAKDKAEKMTSAASTKIGDVLSIDETERISPPIHMAYAKAEGALQQDLAPGIESKPETISVNVSVKFLIR